MSLALASLLVATAATAQTAAPASGGRTDLYHVQFLKAAPGKASEAAAALKANAASTPGHVVVLRHQAGDEWDYCIIEHLGTSTTVQAVPATQNPLRDLTAWHTDTFASGPSWADFEKAMMPSGAGATGSVYSVAVWRAIPGRTGELEKALGGASQPAKVPVSSVMLQHREGGPWTFLAIDRYNSWQDYGTDMGATVPQTGTGQDPWSDVRQYSTYHHDTLCDRVALK
jgi:hypothetical protein